MQLWIVGQTTKGTWNFNDDKYDFYEWEFAGVFDSEEKAVKACRFSNYFVAPMELNKEFPHETVEMPNSYYPHKV